MEDGFHHSGQLGGIVYIDDEVPTSCTVDVCEVDSFRLEVLHYGLHNLVESPLLHERVSSLCGHAGTDHEAHIYSLLLSDPLAKRATLFHWRCMVAHAKIKYIPHMTYFF